MAAKEKPTTGLPLLREPFPDHQVSLLPKPTAKREVMDQLPKAICRECGNYHATSKIIHLDYVGHAAVTDRLLDADPNWGWEPLAIDCEGLPKFDKQGGLWIKLTVCGVTRLGYGDADGKTGGNATKEAIGDAIRNAALRFGVALELWHKGDLHLTDEEPQGDASGASDAGHSSDSQEWDNDALSQFAVIEDRAYTAFKAAGMKDAYNDFQKKWKEARKANPPKETLAKFEDVVKKLEDAAAKKKTEPLGQTA